MKTLYRCLSIVVFASAVIGCSNTPEPRVVRASDLEKMPPLAEGQPLIVQFEAGDEFPLEFTLDGPLVGTAAGSAAIPLTVKQSFFLRIDRRGLRVSKDGKDFDAKPLEPGAFQFGIHADHSGVKAHIGLKTPTPRGAAANP
ncbi:MAG: hypothetical protein U0271_46650 [Polyangiaceae bacterium]